MDVDIDLLKNKVPLKDYIERHYPDVDMNTMGARTFVTCPSHEEKTPSCLINDDNTFHCFSCHQHGTLLDYVAIKEGWSLPEDFKRVCTHVGDAIGVEVVFEAPNPEHEAYKDEMQSLNQFYWSQLRTNQDAFNYLTVERKLTPETIKRFRIGYSPMDEYKRRKIGYISNRIAFPILEMKPASDIRTVRCIAMGYRKLNADDDGPKYVNDPTKEGVFNKKNVLYGYAHAYDSIRQNRYAFVVEGYMDVISMHQAGLTNTVGCMGTALTEEQADALRKITSNLFLFLDSDSAGQSNMMRVLPMLIEKGFKIKIVDSKDGSDPADICKKYKFEESIIRAYIKNNSKYAVKCMIDMACQSYDEAVISERIKALSSVEPLINLVQNESERSVYETMLRKRLDLV